MFSVPNGKPGVLPAYLAVHREVFSANRQFAQFVAGALTIDGTASGCAINSPYSAVLLGGMLMGRVTSTGKYANGIVGQLTAAYTHGGTSLQTDVNTATELARRLGGSGTLKLTGPPTVGGVVATQAVAFSAINTTTGVVTITATGADAINGSFLQPADGSESIVTVLCDGWGKRVTDQLNQNRVDVLDAHLLAAGGTINTAMIVNYPSDTSMKAWVKAAIRTACPAVNFSDDFQ